MKSIRSSEVMPVKEVKESHHFKHQGRAGCFVHRYRQVPEPIQAVMKKEAYPTDTVKQATQVRKVADKPGANAELKKKDAN